MLASTRSDLAAIRSLESLVASYVRESFHRGGGAPEPSEAPYRQAVLAAYALRWLELSVEGDGPARVGGVARMDETAHAWEGTDPGPPAPGDESAHMPPTAHEDAADRLRICSAGC